MRPAERAFGRRDREADEDRLERLREHSFERAAADRFDDLERLEREAIQAESADVPITLESEAIGWARAGHPVIPLWWPEPDGSCGCGDPHDGRLHKPRDIGKHPITELVEHGISQAAIDLALIHRWFWKFPGANYGIRVGERFIVLDFDSDVSFGRFRSTLATLGISLPVTITIKTGRGFHVWLSIPEGFEPHAPDFIETIKHGNAYIVGPGSLHVNGRRYERMTPRGTPIAACPKDLLDRLKRRSGSRRVVATGGKVPINSRHEVWISFAAYLHNMGLSAIQKVPVMLALRDVAFETPEEKTPAEAREIAEWYEDKDVSSPVTRPPIPAKRKA